MTTRERIETLFEAGTEPHVIAALLNLTVTDVAETLAIPAHTPADPGGGEVTAEVTAQRVRAIEILGISQGQPYQLPVEQVQGTVLMNCQVAVKLDGTQTSSVSAELYIASDEVGLASAISSDSVSLEMPALAEGGENGPPKIVVGLTAILPAGWWFEVRVAVHTGGGSILIDNINVQPLS